MEDKTIYIIMCDGVPVVAFESKSYAMDVLEEKKADNEFMWGLEHCNFIAGG